MPVSDIKVSLRKRGSTDFSTDGFRMLPITKKEYVIGLLGADGRIDPSLMPAFLFDARQYIGILDLDEQGLVNIDTVVTNEWSNTTDKTAQGSYLEVTSAGFLANDQGTTTDYEIIGAGDEGVNTFPIHLEVGDYLVLAKINDSAPTYSFAIVNRSHGIADADQYGITKLYAGVNSTSDVLAATAGAVKTAYDLASGKEPAFTKNTAFNKNFGTAAGTVTQGNDARLSDARPASDVEAWAKAAVKPSYTYTEVGAEAAFSKNTAFNKNFGTGNSEVARGDHAHSTYDKSQGVGSQFVNAISITDGIVTNISFNGITTTHLPMDTVGQSNVLWSGLTIENAVNSVGSTAANASSAAADAASAATAAALQGIKYYDGLVSADAGGHAPGDIVLVLEA